MRNWRGGGVLGRLRLRWGRILRRESEWDVTYIVCLLYMLSRWYCIYSVCLGIYFFVGEYRFE